MLPVPNVQWSHYKAIKRSASDTRNKHNKHNTDQFLPHLFYKLCFLVLKKITHFISYSFTRNEKYEKNNCLPFSLRKNFEKVLRKQFTNIGRCTQYSDRWKFCSSIIQRLREHLILMVNSPKKGHILGRSVWDCCTLNRHYPLFRKFWNGIKWRLKRYRILRRVQF